MGVSPSQLWEAVMALLQFKRKDTAATPVRGDVEAFLKDYSIEVMPRTAEKVETFRDLPADMRFLVIAFSSDWLYPPYQSKEIVRGLKIADLVAIFASLDIILPEIDR